MPKGSRPGERRGGRKPGVPNKATREIKEVAQQYGPAALKKLAELAGLVKGTNAAESEQARVSAVREILDRAYGKAPQAIIGDPSNPLQGRLTVEFKVVDPK